MAKRGGISQEVRDRPLVELARILATHFDREELRTLCFHLGIDYDDLPAEGKGNKAREIVKYLERRSRITELVETGKRLRPDIPWGDTPKGADQRPPMFHGASRQALPLPNPLVPLSGRISDPGRVYDREREISRAIELLRAGSSVAFVGPAGVGKSSLLTKLMAVVPERLGLPWEGAWLDLQNVQDEKDFYSALCNRLGIANCRGYALARALQGRRVLLCLDEVEAITGRGFSRGVRAQLRGLAEGGNAPLKLALVARTSLDRLFPDSEGLTSPLANVCLQVEVDPWDMNTSRGFILSVLQNSGVRFPEEEISRLAIESDGHPRRLMILCHETYMRVSEVAT